MTMTVTTLAESLSVTPRTVFNHKKSLEERYARELTQKTGRSKPFTDTGLILMIGSITGVEMPSLDDLETWLAVQCDRQLAKLPQVTLGSPEPQVEPPNPKPSEVVDGEVWEPEAPGMLELRTHTQLDRVSRRAELPPLPTIQIKDTRALIDDHEANLSYQSQASQALEQAITQLAQAEGEHLAATYKAEVSKQLAMGKLQALQDLLGTQREVQAQ